MEAHSSPTRNGSRLIAACAVLLIISSILKFSHPAAVLDYLGSFGFEDEKVYLIGGLELLVALLLLWRRTRPFGLLLASAYLGGAIAAHLGVHGYAGVDPYVSYMATHPYVGVLEPGVVLAVLWLGMWFPTRRRLVA